jgi:hypothetical protein
MRADNALNSAWLCGQPAVAYVPPAALSGTFPCQIESFPCGGLTSRLLMRKDIHVLEPEHHQVLILVLRRQAEGLAAARLRALKIPGQQGRGAGCWQRREVLP